MRCFVYALRGIRRTVCTERNMRIHLAFAFPMLFPAPILTQFASLLGYHAYLKMRYLLPMRCGAVALLAVIPMAALCLYDSFSPAENRGKNKK